jgi:hypothetical protein
MSFRVQGDERRIERHVVRSVVPIASRAFGVVHDHALFRHAQHHRDLLPQAVDALRMRPDLERVASFPRDGA